MDEPSPHCSIVICAFNGREVLPACLGSLRALSGPTFEVIVVDNGSGDGSAALVARDHPEFRLIRNGRNLGFAGGNNVGIRAAAGELIVLLNQDTEVPPDWLEKVAAPFARDPGMGAVGCKLLYPGGKIIQHAGGVIHANANTSHLGYGEEDRGQWDQPGERMYLSGAALALRRAALAEVGLLDPGFHPAYFEEVDLLTRMARAGWKTWYEPAARVIHHESQSLGTTSPRFIWMYTSNRLRYLALHGPREGWRAALRAEAGAFRGLAGDGHALPMLRAYAAAALRWPSWRLDRHRRRSAPPLDTPAN